LRRIRYQQGGAEKPGQEGDRAHGECRAETPGGNPGPADQKGPQEGAANDPGYLAEHAAGSRQFRACGLARNEEN